MKTILKLTCALALAAVVNSVFATGNLQLNMIALDNEKAVIAISTLLNSNFNIKITDEKGQIVYYQESYDENGGYHKVYDFSNLDEGTYKLTVVNDDLSTERQFQKTRGRILVGNEKTTLEPYFGHNNNLMRFAYLNFDKEPVTLHFYNSEAEIYTRAYGKEFNIQQALNISKLDKGSYEAVLSAGEKQFTYTLEIQ